MVKDRNVFCEVIKILAEPIFDNMTIEKVQSSDQSPSPYLKPGDAPQVGASPENQDRVLKEIDPEEARMNERRKSHKGTNRRIHPRRCAF